MERLVAIRDLKPGDMIDLENDPHVEMSDENRTKLECELCVVDEIEHETAECTVVHFTNFVSHGFPPDHQVKVHSP